MVRRVHVEVRTTQLVILLIMVDDVWNRFLVIEAALVDSILGEVRLDDIELAQMPSAAAIITDAIIFIMMAEVGRGQLRSSLPELVFVGHTKVMVVLALVRLHKFVRVDRVLEIDEFATFERLHFRLELGTGRVIRGLS